jgi:hypothetical protein
MVNHRFLERGILQSVIINRIIFHSPFLASCFNIFNLCAGKKTMCNYVTRFQNFPLPWL